MSCSVNTRFTPTPARVAPPSTPGRAPACELASGARTPASGVDLAPVVKGLQLVTPQAAAASFERLRGRHGLLKLPHDAVEALLLAVPRGPDIDSKSHLRATIRAYLTGICGVDIELARPSTPPTASRVYILRSAGHVVAVFKLFGGGAEGFFEEITAIELLRTARLRAALTAPIWGIGSMQVDGERRGYLLMGAAPGHDLDTQVVSDTDYANALVQCAVAVAELHQRFPPSTDTAAVAQVRDYHADYVRRLATPTGALAACVARGWLTAAAATALGDAVTAVAEAYAKTPVDELPVGVTHGDCYPANYIFAPPDQLTMIDLQTLMWSLGPETDGPHGIADVREDVGRFYEALVAQGLRCGDKIPDARAKLFLDTYNQSSARPVDATELEFFRLRYDAMAFGVLAARWQAPTASASLRINEPGTRALLMDLCARYHIDPTAP